MPVKLIIEFHNSIQGGVDVSYQATPKGETTTSEVDLANQMVAICSLMSNEKFHKMIDPMVEEELSKLHAVEGHSKMPSNLVM